VERKRVKIGNYLRGNLLGEGSFGAVYEGYNVKEKRVVAVKVCTNKIKKVRRKKKIIIIIIITMISRNRWGI
jgi:serine/threonine protein kinase